MSPNVTPAKTVSAKIGSRARPSVGRAAGCGRGGKVSLNRGVTFAARDVASRPRRLRGGGVGRTRRRGEALGEAAGKLMPYLLIADELAGPHLGSDGVDDLALCPRRHAERLGDRRIDRPAGLGGDRELPFPVDADELHGDLRVHRRADGGTVAFDL